MCMQFQCVRAHENEWIEMKEKRLNATTSSSTLKALVVVVVTGRMCTASPSPINSWKAKSMMWQNGACDGGRAEKADEEMRKWRKGKKLNRHRCWLWIVIESKQCTVYLVHLMHNRIPVKNPEKWNEIKWILFFSSLLWSQCVHCSVISCTWMHFARPLSLSLSHSLLFVISILLLLSAFLSLHLLRVNTRSDVVNKLHATHSTEQCCICELSLFVRFSFFSSFFFVILIQSSAHSNTQSVACTFSFIRDRVQ